MKRVWLRALEPDPDSFSDEDCGDGRGECFGKGVGNGGGGAPNTTEIEQYEVKEIQES